MEWRLLYIVVSLISLSSHLLFCASDDRLSLGESISLNETLVSDGGAFALGFFSPGNSSSNFYLGIWYNNIARGTIVWVANREKPINDSSATLRISDDSNLIVMDSEGGIFWSSNVTSAGSSKNSTVAVLLSTGNLVLRQGGDTILWQSFDHPVDTFIPGMKLEFNYKTRKTDRLTSWKDPQDPSLGNFSFGGDPRNYLQLLTWRGSEPYWRSSVWGGGFFSGVQSTNTSSITYLAIIANEDEIYMSFSLSDGSSNSRYKLDHSGQLQLLGWDYSLKNWSIMASQPLVMCDRYGYCGPFGYCDHTESVPTCKCLKGFEPRFQSDWNRGNFSGGCARTTALECGSRDGFLTLGGMKLPDGFLLLRNKSVDECKAECAGNCSCNAYAYANLSMGTGNVSRCLVWMEDFIDAGMVSSGGENLYFRLAVSELAASKRGRRVIIIAAPVFAAIFSITLTCLAWKFRDKIKGIRKHGRSKGTLLDDLSLNTEIPKDLSGSSGLGEGKHGHGPELSFINFESIAVATDNFSDSHKLGQGGFGKVYKGKLPEGQEVAVKRLSRNSGQGLEEFKNEVLLIAQLQHRNLVRLLGCCIQGEEKLLIYEYMPNKSLDAFLFDPTKKQLLDWGKRFNIIKGIARGLLYLHQDSRLKIIHRDLKASNILLDQDMNPKISDFGMARIFGGDQNEANTNRVVGTYGYMSPEYAMGGLFSVKSDIYSFGVLILEIISSSRNSSFHLTMDFPSLLAYAWKVWNEGNAKDLTDPSIVESCSLDEVFRCIHIGLLCVQDHPNNRPSMSSIVFMLENETTINLTPREPTFTIERNLDDDYDAQVQNLEIFSANNLTVTMPDGR